MPTYDQIKEHDRVRKELELNADDTPKYEHNTKMFSGKIIGTMKINAEGEYELIPISDIKDQTELQGGK